MYQERLSDGINHHIFLAIEKSISTNNKLGFTSLSSFILDTIAIAIKNKSLDIFYQYINYPAYYYDISLQKSKRNSSLIELHHTCFEQGAGDLKSIISSLSSIRDNDNIGTDSDNELALLNKFYYSAFNSYSLLFYSLINNSDTASFGYAINEFFQISEPYFGKSHELRYQISLLIQNDVPTNKDVLKSLRKQYEYQEEYHTYKRHVFSGVKAWAFYMYSVDKISTEAVISFVSNELMPVDAPSDIIRDVLFFRSGLRNYSYLGWGNWNDEKSHPGIVYTPPSPSYWLTLGFLAEQIRENTLFFNLEDFDAKALENIEYLSQTIAEQCQYFIIHFDKWKAVLNSPNTDDLVAKCNNIKSVFNAVNAKRTTEVERAIVNSPLAPRYVNEFKSNVGASWRNSARMRQLFKKNRNTVLILDDDIKLKRIGQRTFFEKAKMMFIDNEFHQKIHNMEIIGAQTGTWEDDEFFNTIIKNNLLNNTGSSYIEAIDIALKDLNANGVIPTGIFISREATYSEHEFTDSPRFTSRYNEATTNQELRNFYLGTFDGIAVYCPFSNFIRNRVIVCDFAQSFEMIYKTHLDWFDEELNIEIKEVTPLDALRKLDENPSKWKLTEDGSEISNDEALLKVSTSVIMDIWSVADFRIKSSTSYVVVNVKA